MTKMRTIKKVIICAVCIALCVVLPLAFHSIPNAGVIFSPMHIPVLICGLVCGWPYGLFAGLAGPALSCLFTGMPPVTMLPQMMVECLVYGLVSGLLMKVIKTKNVIADLYICLVIAMIAGRIVNGLAKALIFARGTTTIITWATTSFVLSWPGILIQLILIPWVVFALMKARLIPERYPKKREEL